MQFLLPKHGTGDHDLTGFILGRMALKMPKAIELVLPVSLSGHGHYKSTGCTLTFRQLSCTNLLRQADGAWSAQKATRKMCLFRSSLLHQGCKHSRPRPQRGELGWPLRSA